MSKEDNSYTAMMLVLILFSGLILMVLGMGLGKVFYYVGIPLDNNGNDDDVNIIFSCLVFISILLALRALSFLYFKKIDGDWTPAGKTRWRYCIYGAIVVLVISTPIEYLNISRDVKNILEVPIITVIAVYFYGKYRQKHKKFTPNG